MFIQARSIFIIGKLLKYLLGLISMTSPSTLILQREGVLFGLRSHWLALTTVTTLII